MRSIQVIRWLMACILLLLPHRFLIVAADYAFQEELPSRQIHLNAAVLTAAPPLAVRDEATREFSGFQIDLLEKIKEFALQDGIILTVELKEGPLYGYTELLNQLMKDCNTTSNPVPQEDCYQHDILIGDFYTNADRSMKVDFTPPWLQTSVSALKKATSSHQVQSGQKDITTMEEADRARATICALVVHDDGVLDAMARIKYPNAKYLECSSMDLCLAELKAGNCALFINDELKLRHMSVLDPTLEVTKERSNSQYITWPLRSNLPPIVLRLMKRWMYEAKSSAYMDELFEQYFSVNLCPIGKAGPNCDQSCDDSHGRSDRLGKCVCDSTKWIGEDCSIEVLEDVNALSTQLLAIGYSMVALNVAAVVVCAGWLWVNRSTPQVQVAQPFFLGLVLLGCVISTSTIVAFGQDSREDGEVNSACMAIPWLYSVGFSITFGTLFAKIRSVFIMFQSAVDLRPVSVSAKETLFIIGAVLALDVTILTVWTIEDPLVWERHVVTQDKFGEPLSSEGVCISNHWMAFAGTIGCLHFCLLGFACYYCYLARHIPTRFSEGKYVTIAIISNLQIFVVAIPVLVVLGTEPQANFFVRSIIVWMNDFVVVILIFGNLMRSVWRDHKHDITGIESIRISVEKFTQQKLKTTVRNSMASDCAGSTRTPRNNVGLSHLSSQLEDMVEMDGPKEATKAGLDDNHKHSEETPNKEEENSKESATSGKQLIKDLLHPTNLAAKQQQMQALGSQRRKSTPRGNRALSSSSNKLSEHACTEKLRFTSMLGAMSSLTLSEIDEDLPFDAALRYSESNRAMPDKPPMFPRRTTNDDMSSCSEHSDSSEDDGGGRDRPDPIEEGSDEDLSRSDSPSPPPAFTPRSAHSVGKDTVPSRPTRLESEFELIDAAQNTQDDFDLTKVTACYQSSSSFSPPSMPKRWINDPAVLNDFQVTV